jgi:hypothetical protein
MKDVRANTARNDLQNEHTEKDTRSLHKPPLFPRVYTMISFSDNTCETLCVTYLRLPCLLGMSLLHVAMACLK